MTRSLFRAASVAALLLLLQPAPVLGHAAFVSGTPGPGDELVGPPDELVIEFSQDLNPSRTSLEVRDASGASLARGGELGDGPREFRLTLPELLPGEYTVRWTSFSREDGELARDTYSFTVVTAPNPSLSPSPSPSAAASPSPTPVPATAAPTPGTVPVGPAAGGDGGAILPILAASVLVAAIAVWLLRRRAV